MFKIFFRAIFWPRVSGLENIPQGESFILCANHTSYFDIPAAAFLVKTAKVRFLAKEELNRKMVHFLYPKAHVIPVRRGVSDPGAVKKMTESLKTGWVLIIFPEGTRGDGQKLRRGKTGAALASVLSGLPLIPVGLPAKYKIFRRHKINVGKPLKLSAPIRVPPSKETLRKITADIMEEISRLSGIDCDANKTSEPNV
jgi:1-acyl-sn-glycerol-3-phosphate acyltransferase